MTSCIVWQAYFKLIEEKNYFFYRVTGVQKPWLQHRDHCRKLSLTSGKWCSKEMSKSLLCWQSWRREIRWGHCLHTDTLNVLYMQTKHCTVLFCSLAQMFSIGWGICISNIFYPIIYLLNLLSNEFLGKSVRCYILKYRGTPLKSVQSLSACERQSKKWFKC